MKIKINHNLSEDDLRKVLKSLSSEGKKESHLRLPADNPAQEEVSKKVLSFYKKIMVDDLGKKISEYLKKEFEHD